MPKQKKVKCTMCGTKFEQTKFQKEIDQKVCQSCLEGIEEDCDREMYGDDYDHLKNSGWIDRHYD